MLWIIHHNRANDVRMLSFFNETAQDINIKKLKPTLIFSLLNIMAGVVIFLGT